MNTHEPARIVGMVLEASACVTRLLALLLIVACGKGRDAATSTIPPADPRPAPQQTASIGDEPMVTTSGSPRPAEALPPGTQIVTIANGRIEMRSLIPIGHTAMRIHNTTASEHQLELRGASGSTSAPVPPGRAVILQQTLRDPRYELVCVTPGHRERAAFETYRPGSPLPPGAAD